MLTSLSLWKLAQRGKKEKKKGGGVRGGGGFGVFIGRGQTCTEQESGSRGWPWVDRSRAGPGQVMK